MNSPDPISRLLAGWHLRPTRDPNFRTSVWARIARRQSAPTFGMYLRAHTSLAAGALAIALVLGGLAGRTQARERVSHDRAELARAYVQALDARAMSMP
jgi:hypothetical protein